MGHEGAATREYYRAWREAIGPDWGFTARQRRPPPDPVNAMLSFAYTLLTSEAIAALSTARLHPAIGFLHQARWGRPNLALDLIEEFRPVLVAAVALRCLTTGIVRAEDFSIEPDTGCPINPRARHAFLAAYERRMLTLFTHEPTGRRVSYRVGVGLQARSLARTILDPDRPYRPSAGSNQRQACEPCKEQAMRYLITYDIADDGRREDIATVLSGYGPRVQLSVFECDTRSRTEITELRAKLRALIDPAEDQIRLYPLDETAIRSTIVLGARTIEERQDFWIVT